MTRPMTPLFVAALLILGGSAVAQTPVGFTPANEGVCDDLVTATPGLYGPCIAFCEAQDCDPRWDENDPFADCKPASDKILENYRSHMEPGDPDMPCLQPHCPCWADEEIDGLRYPQDGDFVLCTVDESVNGAFTDLDRWIVAGPPFSYSTYMSTLAWEASIGGPGCVFWDRCDKGEDCLNVLRLFEITEEEYSICAEGFARAASDRGILCN